MSQQFGFKNSQDYLDQSHKFKLGFLPTEQSHPGTWELSIDAKENLPKAINSLKKLDENVFNVLSEKIDEATELSLTLQKVLQEGGRVFLFGCGATGRLSLLIESIWNKVNPLLRGQVMSFMSGGDIAVVQSVEGFEDFTSYGARQLEELGFNANDILICSTEGGETPIVIGAAQKACEISKHPTYFIYCNPTDLLVKHLKRSREIINHPRVKAIELFCGPMGIAGSTRMQASTILQVFISMALFYRNRGQINEQLLSFKSFFEQLDLSFLIPYIEMETGIYVSFDRLNYHVDSSLALNVFTDTTERAPTFSMKPFEHPDHLSLPLSLCYIKVNGAKTAEQAWQNLLYRDPRALDWPEEINRVSKDYLLGFDFSSQGLALREQMAPCKNNFYITDSDEGFEFNLNGHKHFVELPSQLHDIWKQALLKVLLNMHSTILMGCLNRYQNNLMTWVSPSNGKLIDRTTRYIQYFLKEKGIDYPYESIVQEIFNINLKKDRSMVLEVVRLIEEKHDPS